MIADHVAVHNERVKIMAGFFNALGIAIIGIGALAPVAAFLTGPGSIASAIAAVHGPLVATSLFVGLAFHASAHYNLGYIKKATSDVPA